MADAQVGRPIINARSVNQDTVLPWTVVVQVLHKSTVKLSRDRKRYQTYVLIDEEGTIVSATAHENSVGPVSRKLVPYQRYHLSNAYVKLVRPEYKISDYDCTWTLSGKIPIELIYDPLPKNIPLTFQFTPFSELRRWIDHTKELTIKGLIVHSYPIGDPTMGDVPRDYIIVDEEKMHVMIRVWGDLIDNEYHHVTTRFPQPTVAILMNIKVTSHHGMSIGTGCTTCIFKDPPSPTTSSLREWYESNSRAINDMILEETYKDRNMMFPPPSPADIIPIPTAAALIEEKKVMWVSGTPQLIPGQRSLWYKSCQGCIKSVGESVTWELTCTMCGFRGVGRPRCHIGIYLCGGDATLPLTLFSDAEKLILCTAADLKAADEKNAPLHSEVSLHIQNKKIYCFIKRLDKSFQGNSMRTYPVLKMYLESELPSTELSAANLVPVSGIASTSTTKDVSTTPDSSEKLFFSPTTKAVIAEIHDTDPKIISAPATSSAKRPLSYAGLPAHTSLTPSGNEDEVTVLTDEDLQPTAALNDPVPETLLTKTVVGKMTDTSSAKNLSPGKKLKNKED